jgi:quinol monooxygenase YgiN
VTFPEWMSPPATALDATLLDELLEPDEVPDETSGFDLWTSEDAHARALQAPEMEPYVAAVIPLLEGVPEQIEVLVRGGKGTPDS